MMEHLLTFIKNLKYFKRLTLNKIKYVTVIIFL